MPNERLRRESSATEAYKWEERSDTKLMTCIKQEQSSSDELRIKQKFKTRRHRASVACTSCRDRRIRCVVPAGKKACVQCERSSTPCIIKDDDERRRPISRAYVHSLVERVALLEQILEDEGYTVPHAHYPPEIRHRSRRSGNTSSANKTSSKFSTSHECSISDDHSTSSPCYCADTVQDESFMKERSSGLLGTNHMNGQCNNKMRYDSHIKPADVKVRRSVENTLESIIQYDGPFEFDHATSRIPPSQTSFWPMAYDHTGVLTLSPILQEGNIENHPNSARENVTFGSHEYNGHPVTTQFGDALPGAHQHEARSTDKNRLTNLDFMALACR